MLVTATVQRDRIIAVKLGRGETEVITKSAMVVSVEPLAETAGAAEQA